MKKITLVLAAVALVAAYLLWWPVPIEPQAWTPPPAPALEGPYQKNEALKGIQRLAEGVGNGPEGLSFDAEGRIYAGYVDGRVMRFAADGTGGTELANTGGRPLGTLTMPDGSLVVADAAKGLLRIGADGAIQPLSTEADGVPFRFADDVDAARQSEMLYFTDASDKFGHHEVMEDIMEHGGNGRFLRYHLPTGRTTTLLADLHFPNGVAVGPDDAFVLVNETARYRILRYWLKGPRAGQSEVFAENLPGFPDNINFNGRDRFWCAIYSPRVPDLDRLLPQPFLRKVVFRLPDVFQPKPAKHAFALAFDLDGKVVANLQYAAADAYAPITSVEEVDGWLYFGSLTEPAMGRMRLDQVKP